MRNKTMEFRDYIRMIRESEAEKETCEDDSGVTQ